jgi:hypothetical protein
MFQREFASKRPLKLGSFETLAATHRLFLPCNGAGAGYPRPLLSPANTRTPDNGAATSPYRASVSAPVRTGRPRCDRLGGADNLLVLSLSTSVDRGAIGGADALLEPCRQYRERLHPAI